jgi:hypothetical protein
MKPVNHVTEGGCCALCGSVRKHVIGLDQYRQELGNGLSEAIERFKNAARSATSRRLFDARHFERDPY